MDYGLPFLYNGIPLTFNESLISLESNFLSVFISCLQDSRNGIQSNRLGGETGIADIEYCFRKSFFFSVFLPDYLMDLRQHVRHNFCFCLFSLTRSRPIRTLLQNIPDLMSLIGHLAERMVILLIRQRIVLQLRPALADCLEVAQEKFAA